MVSSIGDGDGHCQEAAKTASRNWREEKELLRMMRLKLPYASKSGATESLEFLDHLFVVVYY